MARIKAPLPECTDGEVLLAAALDQEALARAAVDDATRLRHRALAARLRMIKRRVPLWTERERRAA